MEFLHSLADDLDALTEALGDPVLDLEAVLSVLTDDLAAAVPSYLGLSMTLQIAENHFTLESFTTATAAGAQSSLRLPLLPQGADRPGGQVVLYAQTPGAFSDLADDARWMFTLNGQAILDGHLPPVSSAAPAGIGGFTEFSDINQALGVLMSMGHTHQEAQIELHRHALRHQRSALDVARGLLTTITPTSAPGH